jgi:hypothetical protein
LEWVQKFLHFLRFLAVEGDPDYHQSPIPISSVKLVEHRDLLPAGAAPGCPKFDKDDLSLEEKQVHPVALQVQQGENGSGKLFLPQSFQLRVNKQKKGGNPFGRPAFSPETHLDYL